MKQGAVNRTSYKYPEHLARDKLSGSIALSLPIATARPGPLAHLRRRGIHSVDAADSRKFLMLKNFRLAKSTNEERRTEVETEQLPIYFIICFSRELAINGDGTV